MRPLRVAYVVKMFPRLSETFVVNEILELERRGVEVAVLSLRKPSDGRFHPSVCHVRAPVRYFPDWKPEEAFAAARTALADLRAAGGDPAGALAFLLERRVEEPLRLFAQGLWAGIEAARLGTGHLHAHFASSGGGAALIAHLSAGHSYSFTAHAKDIYRDAVDPDLFREKVRRARFVVTVSDFNRAFIGERFFDGAAPAHVVRLYNGIPLDFFSPPGGSREPGLILGVGRLVGKKGFHHLIAACARLRERRVPFRCRIIGEGPEEARLREEIRARGLGSQAELAGPRTQDEVRDDLARAAVMALPCRVEADGNRDALPTVLLEALAMGVPCVSTRVSGIPEIITPEVGRLVDEGDEEALANALADLLADAPLRRRLGEAGRGRAERLFDARRNVAELCRLFEAGGVPGGGRSPSRAVVA